MDVGKQRQSNNKRRLATTSTGTLRQLLDRRDNECPRIRTFHRRTHAVRRLGHLAYRRRQRRNPLVAEALRAGYRHIDTAQAYGKESGVGKGVRAGREEWGIGRSSVFITTKIAAEAKDYDSALASIDQSRDKLGLDYIDLMIIHSPQPWVEFRGTDKRYFAENLQVWRALEDAQAAGKVKAIGVSNFLEDDLANILENAHTQPAVNQVLAHISNMPTELIDYCHRNGVVVEAYSPLGHGANFRNPRLMSIASTYGVGVAQLWLRYLLDKWLVVLPKITSVERLRTNLELDFALSDEDVLALDDITDAPDYGEHSFFPVFGGKL